MLKGKKYRKLEAAIDPKVEYSIENAIQILKQSEVKFDQTVEIHMNLGVDPKHSDQVVRGTVVLPHGTGKKVRIAVFCKDANVQVALDAGADFAGGVRRA